MIALALGGRTIAEWQAAMSQAEFQAWMRHFIDEPFDDRHRFHRPAALVAASMSGDFDRKLEFLSPEPGVASMPESDRNTLRAFGIKPSAVKR